MIDSILGPGNVGRLSGDSHKDRQTLHYLKVVSGKQPEQLLCIRWFALFFFVHPDLDSAL